MLSTYASALVREDARRLDPASLPLDVQETLGLLTTRAALAQRVRALAEETDGTYPAAAQHLRAALAALEAS